LHAARRVALWREYLCLHKVVLAVARRDELCQRFMGILGVGPISAWPSRQRSMTRNGSATRRPGCLSRAAVAPLASGTSIDVLGHISKTRDGDVRHPLCEAAIIMLSRFRGFSSLKVCSLRLAKKRGDRRACVAVARQAVLIRADEMLE
jgi:transposase